jgi:prepilin-type N-terminal cleavage/methylation domain-containing protein
MANLRINRKKGFTLIELVFVIAIIGIFVAIAVPNFLSFRKKGYNASAVTDLKNAYTAAQIYFSEQPSGTVDLVTLRNYGFKSSPGVNLSIHDSSNSGLSMIASHSSGDKTYSIDFDGDISSN